MWISRPSSWLTARRLRAHGLILVVCLWSVYIWDMSTPGLRDRGGNLKGTDFIHLYTLGSVALAHRGMDLYDSRAQAVLAAQRVPASAGIRYDPVYPPQMSVFLAPLARLSYEHALLIWLLAGALCYGLCCYALWRACPNLREQGWTVFLLAAGFPGFFHLILWGQGAWLALVCFTLMFFLLRDERWFLAGLVLGCLIFKPQLGIAAAVVFVSARAWKVVMGAILSATMQLSVGWFYYGMDSLREWLRVLLHVRDLLHGLDPKPYQTHSFRTFWTMLIPYPDVALGLYIVSALLVLGLTVAYWTRARSTLALRYSSMLLTTVLVAPHLTVYDLVILVPAFLLLADWLVKQPSSRWVRQFSGLLYLTYLLPIAGPLALWTHVQPSVIVMTALVYMIWTVNGDHATSAET